MISIPLYKQGIKSNFKLWTAIALVLTLYFSVIISMFDPKMGSVLDALSESMPEIMSMVGMGATDGSMISFLASYLYGFIMLVMPMIVSIVIAHRLVAFHVDRGSMAYLLAAPVTRRKMILTQLFVLWTFTVSLTVFATIIGIVVSNIAFPGALDIGSFLFLNLGALIMQLFIAGICFLCSCTFNEGKSSLGFGAGIPILAYVVQMMGNTGGGLEAAKYATFFTLFDPEGIVAGDMTAILGIVVLAMTAILLYGSSIAVFRRRNLPV